MASWNVALYYGLGIFLSQTLHTLYSQRNAHQKKVPFFEHVTWLGAVGRRFKIAGVRRLPDVSRYVDPHPVERLQPHYGVSIHPLLKPWKLPYFQRTPPPYERPWKYVTARVTRLFGLQATNLIYCYVAAAVFSVVSIFVLRFGLPIPDSFDTTNVSVIFAVFGLLVGLSWEFVGSSFAQLAIESTLALNAIVLITSSVASPEVALSLLGLGATIVVAGLLNWMAQVREDDEFDRGNLVAGYYALGSLLYAESIVLGLLLTRLG